MLSRSSCGADRGALGNRDYYDGYGKPYNLGSGGRSRYGYAGGHGYAEDGASGMLLCGARFYLPGIGRFLTPDPIGHEGGLNLYAYCENNPVNAVDPKGTQGVGFVGFGMGELNARGIDVMNSIGQWWSGGGLWDFAPHNRSWRSARTMTNLFEDDLGPISYHFKGWGSPEVRNIAFSGIGMSVLSRAMNASTAELRKGIDGSVNSRDAYLNTIYNFDNGTQAMVGAVTWRARLVGDNLNVVVWNKMGRNSLFFHATAPMGIPDTRRYYQGQPYGNVNQYFQWSWRFNR